MRKRRAIVIHEEFEVVNELRGFFASRDYEVVAYSEPGICPLYTDLALCCSGKRPCSDIIISDYALPRMSGLTLLEAQSSRGCGLTGENKAIVAEPLPEEVRKRITSLGFAYFQKPLDLRALSVWVEECEKRMDLELELESRRLETRHAASYEIRCAVDTTDNEFVNGMVVNISNNGLCVKLPRQLRRWQTVRIETGLPLIACHLATVRWAKKNSEGSYDTGLRCH